jgi:hypothetical protein
MISRTSKIARISWAVAYAFFTLAGVLAFFTPSQLILDALVSTLVYSWSAFLLVGAALSLGGKAANSWVGEIIGLPLLATSNVIFGITLCWKGANTFSYAIGGIFVGFGVVCLGRWIELRSVARANQEVNSEL